MKSPLSAGKKPRLIQAAAIALSLLLFAALFFYARAGRSTYDENGLGISYESARVLEVLADNTAIDETTENVRRGSQELRVELLTGRYKGEVTEVTNYLSAFYNVYVQEGDKIAVSVNTTADGRYSLSVYNYSRDIWIWVFVAVFALILIAVGGWQGLKAILSLAVTVFCVIFLLVPLLVQRGWPAIPTTLAIIAYTIFVSFVILGGVQVKTMVAAAGSFGGVLLAGLLAWGACRIVHISGMNMDEAESLLLTACDNGLKIKGLLICGILIAAEGAVMDIAMSISSAVCELHTVNPELTARQLFRSGMNIGRDAMGTMAN
ncbi:MAG: YibE/F family protein, partial [Candidatus Enterenecus sp.]